MTIKRVYWDSCVFIDRIAREPKTIEILESISDCAREGKIIIIASTLCIAETCKIGESTDTWSVQQRLILDFFENPWIEVVQLDSFVAEFAQTIAHRYPISSSDAVHVATAIMRDADVMHTFDGMSSKRKSLIRSDGKIFAKPSGRDGDSALAIKLPFRIDPQLPLGFESAGEHDGAEVTEESDAVPQLPKRRVLKPSPPAPSKSGS